jgi:hypothetical protein
MSYSHMTAWTKPCTQRKKKTEPSVKKQELTDSKLCLHTKRVPG